MLCTLIQLLKLSERILFQHSHIDFADEMQGCVLCGAA